jgi:ribosome-associated protein
MPLSYSLSSWHNLTSLLNQLDAWRFYEKVYLLFFGQEKPGDLLQVRNMNINILKQSIHAYAEASFSRSGGPGGQNVNKVNSKVTLKIKLAELSGLTDAELERVKSQLANRISNDGELVITSDEERSQRINLERAYFRLEALITAAARLPKQRKATKPSKAAREKRLQNKKYQSQKKVGRLKTLLMTSDL